MYYETNTLYFIPNLYMYTIYIALYNIKRKYFLERFWHKFYLPEKDFYDYQNETAFYTIAPAISDSCKVYVAIKCTRVNFFFLSTTPITLERKRAEIRSWKTKK